MNSPQSSDMNFPMNPSNDTNTKIPKKSAEMKNII